MSNVSNYIFLKLGGGGGGGAVLAFNPLLLYVRVLSQNLATWLSPSLVKI